MGTANELTLKTEHINILPYKLEKLNSGHQQPIFGVISLQTLGTFSFWFFIEEFIVRIPGVSVI